MFELYEQAKTINVELEDIENHYVPFHIRAVIWENHKQICTLSNDYALPNNTIHNALRNFGRDVSHLT